MALHFRKCIYVAVLHSSEGAQPCFKPALHARSIPWRPLLLSYDGCSLAKIPIPFFPECNGMFHVPPHSNALLCRMLCNTPGTGYEPSLLTFAHRPAYARAATQSCAATASTLCNACSGRSNVPCRPCGCSGCTHTVLLLLWRQQTAVTMLLLLQEMELLQQQHL
jgi:hypothetical protein